MPISVLGVSLQIPNSTVRMMVGSQQRADQTELEEFYCLLGYAQEGVTKIVRGFKPPQRAFKTIDWITRRVTTSMVEHNECPSPSTVADYHTHPWGITVPSDIDSTAWRSQNYKYHIISYSGWMQGMAFKVWEVTDDGEIIPLRSEQVEFFSDPSAWGNPAQSKQNP